MVSARFTASLFLLVVFGCFHRSAEDEILQAFAHIPADQVLDRDSLPQYLSFADKAAESVFGHLVDGRRYRLAPKGVPLFCPDASTGGLHGYVMVGARVDTVMGDSAYATVIQDCAFPHNCPNGETSCATMGSGGVRDMTGYLLSRKTGEWRVVRPVVGNRVMMS